MGEIKYVLPDTSKLQRMRGKTKMYLIKADSNTMFKFDECTFLNDEYMVLLHQHIGFSEKIDESIIIKLPQ